MSKELYSERKVVGGVVIAAWVTQFEHGNGWSSRIAVTVVNDDVFIDTLMSIDTTNAEAVRYCIAMIDECALQIEHREVKPAPVEVDKNEPPF
jgi:hypothetical protein